MKLSNMGIRNACFMFSGLCYTKYERDWGKNLAPLPPQFFLRRSKSLSGVFLRSTRSIPPQYKYRTHWFVPGNAIRHISTDRRRGGADHGLTPLLDNWGRSHLEWKPTLISILDPLHCLYTTVFQPRPGYWADFAFLRAACRWLKVQV